MNDNVIREGRLGGTNLGTGRGVTHNLDLNTEHTLLKLDVSGGSVNEISDGLTGVDHETLGELHGLGTGSSKLTRDNDLDTLSARLHNVTDNTVSGSSDSKVVEELELKGLTLSNSGETTLLDTLGVDEDGVLLKVETLADEGGQLTDAATVLTKNLLGVGGSDDNLGLGRGKSDLNTRVSLLGELTGEELVKFSVENTVSDDLSLLRNLGNRHGDIWMLVIETFAKKFSTRKKREKRKGKRENKKIIWEENFCEPT